MRKHLNFTLPKKSSRSYRVRVQSFFRDCKKTDSTFDYTLSFLLKHESFNGYVVEITRNNMMLNNTEFHNVMDELLLITSEILNKLELEISPKGQILHIKNRKELREKWQEIRLQVESDYKGEIVSRFLESMEKTITDEQLFINALWKDPFFRFYFSIYGEYLSGKMTDDYEFFDFPIGNNASYSATETNLLQIQETGGYTLLKRITIDKDELENLRKNLPKYKADNNELAINMHCAYVLSKEKTPLSITSLQEAFINGELYKQVNMQAEFIG